MTTAPNVTQTTMRVQNVASVGRRRVGNAPLALPLLVAPTRLPRDPLLLITTVGLSVPYGINVVALTAAFAVALGVRKTSAAPGAGTGMEQRELLHCAV